MTIQIDSNIPLPKRGVSLAQNTKYPWRVLEVGDSFPVPSDVRIKSFRRAVGQAQLVTGRRFSVRQHDGGYRCWRTA